MADWSLTPECLVDIPGIPGAEKIPTIKCLEPLFQNAVNAIIALSGVVLFIMLIVSGYNFLFSGGDQKKLEKAQGTMTNAIIGLVVIACAYLILVIIKVFTGVDVTKFKITIQ